MTQDNKPTEYKLTDDFIQLTMTCTINKYTITNLTRKKDNTPFRVCNVNAYVVISGKFQNIKLVIYNNRIIDLFDKYPQANKKVLITCKLSIRPYEKDGIKSIVTEYILEDRHTLQVIGMRKGNNNTDNNSAPTPSTETANLPDNDSDILDEFDIDALLRDSE